MKETRCNLCEYLPLPCTFCALGEFEPQVKSVAAEMHAILAEHCAEIVTPQ